MPDLLIRRRLNYAVDLSRLDPQGDWKWNTPKTLEIRKAAAIEARLRITMSDTKPVLKWPLLHSHSLACRPHFYPTLLLPLCVTSLQIGANRSEQCCLFTTI